MGCSGEQVTTPLFRAPKAVRTMETYLSVKTRSRDCMMYHSQSIRLIRSGKACLVNYNYFWACWESSNFDFPLCTLGRISNSRAGELEGVWCSQ